MSVALAPRPNVSTDLRDLDVNGKAACLAFIDGLSTAFVESHGGFGYNE